MPNEITDEMPSLNSAASLHTIDQLYSDRCPNVECSLLLPWRGVKSDPDNVSVVVVNAIAIKYL